MILPTKFSNNVVSIETGSDQSGIVGNNLFTSELNPCQTRLPDASIKSDCCVTVYHTRNIVKLRSSCLTQSNLNVMLSCHKVTKKLIQTYNTFVRYGSYHPLNDIVFKRDFDSDFFKAYCHNQNKNLHFGISEIFWGSVVGSLFYSFSYNCINYHFSEILSFLAKRSDLTSS